MPNLTLKRLAQDIRAHERSCQSDCLYTVTRLAAAFRAVGRDQARHGPSRCTPATHRLATQLVRRLQRALRHPGIKLDSTSYAPWLIDQFCEELRRITPQGNGRFFGVAVAKNLKRRG